MSFEREHQSIRAPWRHARPTLTRREFLNDAFCGFGALAVAAMARTEQIQAAVRAGLIPRTPPITPKAKSVIFLFMAGGPSQMETFDPKPLLNRLSGQARPKSFGEAKYQFIEKDAKLLGTKRSFAKYGQSGIEVSDLFPHLSQCVDDLAICRSCYGDMVVHSAAQYELFSGRIVPGAPSMGSWVAYGLGAETESLPGYVVMPDPLGALEAGQPMYSNGFLPAKYQPTMFRPSDQPVLNLKTPPGVSPSERRRTVELIQRLNRESRLAEDPEFQARIAAYDLAFKMQSEAPELFDLSRESQSTLDLYGVG